MELNQYKDLFLTEGQKQLDGLKSSFSKIQKNPAAFDEIKESMRLTHTLKGMAGMMNFDKLTRLSQQMEETLNSFCVSKKEVNTEVITVLSKGLDTLGALVTDVKDDKDSGIQIDELLNELKELNVSS